MCINAEVSAGIFGYGMFVSFCLFLLHIIGPLMKNNWKFNLPKKDGKILSAVKGENLLTLLLVFSVSFMQLNEYFIHKGFDEDGNCTNEGHWASYFVIITLMLQLLVIWFGMSFVQYTKMDMGDNLFFKMLKWDTKPWYVKQKNLIEKGQPIFFVMYTIILSIYVFYSAMILSRYKPEDTCSVRICPKECRLRWDLLTKMFDDPLQKPFVWLYDIIYLLCIFLFAFYVQNLSYILLLLVSLGVSFLYTYFATPWDYTSFPDNNTEKSFRADYMGSFWCIFTAIMCASLTAIFFVSRLIKDKVTSGKVKVVPAP